jgi:hypothetical protein
MFDDHLVVIHSRNNRKPHKTPKNDPEDGKKGFSMGEVHEGSPAFSQVGGFHGKHGETAQNRKAEQDQASHPHKGAILGSHFKN